MIKSTTQEKPRTDSLTPATTTAAIEPKGGKNLSLLDYLETYFLPARLSTRSEGYGCSMRRPVHLFCALLGDRLVGEIDREILDTYKQRLIEAGFTEISAGNSSRCVGVIVRSIHPEVLPDRRKLTRALTTAPDWNDDKVLAVVFGDHFAPQQLADCSEHTKRQYWAAIGLFDDFLGRPARLCDLTDERVDKLMLWLSDSQRSEATVTTIHDHLLAIWRWCAKKRLIDRWPNEKPDGEPIAGLLRKLLGRAGLGGNGKGGSDDRS